MNKPDYNAEMLRILKSAPQKPKVLLHACCAPCSSACLERLKDLCSVTVLFYNPNIEDDEYLKRKGELERLLDGTRWADYMDCDHDTREFYSAVKGLEDCGEGGERCAVCFWLRLEKTAALAKEKGYDFFTTTLTISPLKNAELINETGMRLSRKYGVKWLPSDFKKQNGYLRSIALSKQYRLYRQNYCGCIFSRNNRLN